MSDLHRSLGISLLWRDRLFAEVKIQCINTLKNKTFIVSITAHPRAEQMEIHVTSHRHSGSAPVG